MKAVLTNAMLVGSGGFIGAILRYGLGGLVHRQVPLATFPFGTLVVNLLGCLLIGAFAGLVESRQMFSPEVRAFALIGLLCGFTTFSTFGYETFAMIRDAEYLRVSANVLLHVMLGLGCVWIGYALTGTR